MSRTMYLTDKLYFTNKHADLLAYWTNRSFQARISLHPHARQLNGSICHFIKEYFYERLK